MQKITTPNLYGYRQEVGNYLIEVIRCESIYENGWAVFCYHDGAMLGCGPCSVTKKEAMAFAKDFLRDAEADCDFLVDDDLHRQDHLLVSERYPVTVYKSSVSGYMSTHKSCDPWRKDGRGAVCWGKDDYVLWDHGVVVGERGAKLGGVSEDDAREFVATGKTKASSL